MSPSFIHLSFFMGKYSTNVKTIGKMTHSIMIRMIAESGDKASAPNESIASFDVIVMNELIIPTRPDVPIPAPSGLL